MLMYVNYLTMRNALFNLLNVVKMNIATFFSIKVCILFICIIQLSSLGLKAQDHTVNGMVTDNLGLPVEGVNVTIKNSTNGTITNVKGAYSIKVSRDGVIIFSNSGYLSKEVGVNNKNSLNVQLIADLRSLDQVVVVGYGTRKKSDLTGAVASISAKDFKDQPVYRIDQALQGRAAGVQVVNNSGVPGGDVNIRIRGSNSILGNNNPLYIIDGFIGGDFNNLNPADVESIEVLKDASSTAIYGSRGANGVILITTKKGSSRKNSIDFTSRFANSTVLKKFDLLNAGDFATVVNERNTALGLAPSFTTSQISDYYAKGGTNWQNEIFRTAPAQEYQLSISGGSDKTTYLISGNYLDEKGVINNSGFKRYSIRSNINSTITDKLKVALNFSGARRINTNTSGTQGKSGPLTQALAWAPTTPVKDADGNYITNDPIGSIFANPVALAYEQDNTNVATNANVVARGNYEFIKGLSLDVTLGADYQNIQGASFAGPSVTNNIPNANRSSGEYLNIQNTNTLNYMHNFNKVHNLNITAVFENQSLTFNGFNANANKLIFSNLGYNNLSLAAANGATAGYSKSTIVSYLGRVNYSYKDKYLITGSLRQDGSSKFQGNNKYSLFPSAAVAWKLSEENFIKSTSLFDLLKIRASYGLTGSQAINPYSTLATYLTDPYNAATSFNSSSVTSGFVIGNAANSNLKWETTSAMDVGIDMEMMHGKLRFSADYYNKTTSDLLLSQPLPTYLGGGSITKNVGEINNKGWDFALSATPISSKSGFTWTSTFNVSLLQNNIVSLGGQDLLFTGSNVGSGLSTQPEFVLKTGNSLGAYWGLKYLGTWKSSESAAAATYGAKPGDSKYEDINNDKAINGSDYQIIGNGLPKTSLGWDNTFQYKGFSINVFIQSLNGYDKLNYTYGSAITANADARQATSTDIQNRYIVGKNETSNIPAFSASNKNVIQSTRFLEKGDFIRIKNVNLSYELPKNLIKKASVKLFIGAINLFTITKYKGIDPESSTTSSSNDSVQSIDYGSYPNAKRFIAGFTIKL